MRKNKIARPAARKPGGQGQGQKSKPSKSGARPSQRKPAAGNEPAPQPADGIGGIGAQNPRRRFVELPKVQGELPTPTATFYF